MNNLKYYRKLHNKTQKDVADYLGIVQQAYGHYETGRRQIPLENLLKLAEYYQVTINDLIGMNSIEKFESRSRNSLKSNLKKKSTFQLSPLCAAATVRRESHIFTSVSTAYRSPGRSDTAKTSC